VSNHTWDCEHGVEFGQGCANVCIYCDAQTNGVLAPVVQDQVVERVISQLRARSTSGQAKYGTTLDRTDLSHAQWIQHAQEELMDGILYLEKLKENA